VADLPKDIARFVMRRILPLKERKRHVALQNALTEMAIQTEKSSEHGFDASTVVLNVALFLLIAERDIQAVKIDALTHPDPWHRSLSARIILLTIHEWDMDKVAGHKLRQALDTIKAPDPMKAAATAALRSVRNVQKMAQKEFAFLRNATIAHRDPDASAQYRAITKLDEMKVLGLAAEFYIGADAFISLLPKIILQSSTLPSLLAQYAKRENNHAATRT
jgi:hypothetical protein